MYIVQTQFYTIMGFRGTHHHHQPTLIDSIGRVVVMFLVSYSYHTDKIIQTYTQTRPHTSTWGNTIKNTNTQNNTQKPKDTHTQNTDKHQDTQTLTNTDGQTQNCSSLHIRISCHCLFCPNWNESPSTMLVSFILLSYFYASTFVLLFSIFHCPGATSFF